MANKLFWFVLSDNVYLPVFRPLINIFAFCKLITGDRIFSTYVGYRSVKKWLWCSCSVSDLGDCCLGKLVRRQQLPKNDVGGFWSWKDLNLAMNLPCYGRVFRICDCDRWTKVVIGVCLSVVTVVVSRPWFWFWKLLETKNMHSWSQMTWLWSSHLGFDFCLGLGLVPGLGFVLRLRWVANDVQSILTYLLTYLLIPLHFQTSFVIYLVPNSFVFFCFTICKILHHF